MSQSSKCVAKQGFCQGAKTACPSLANWVSVVATASWRRCLNLTGDVISTKQGFHIIHMLKIWKLRFAKPIFRYDPFFFKSFWEKNMLSPYHSLKVRHFPNLSSDSPSRAEVGSSMSSTGAPVHRGWAVTWGINGPNSLASVVITILKPSIFFGW